jgi:hypothetical protein
VWLIALAMNVSHVYDHLGQAGIRIDDTRRAVLCLAPDVLLLIGVWKLRYRARSALTVDAPTEPAPLLPPPPVAATDVASIPEPLAPRKATAKEPVKAKACPTRQAARQTLLDLDLAGTLAGTTNAELMRTHGGSDVWWGKRRAEYLAELANLGAEAGNL